MCAAVSQPAPLGRWRDKFDRAPTTKKPNRLSPLNRAIAILCFAFIFVTATEPTMPVTMESIATALESFSIPQAFPNTAWR